MRRWRSLLGLTFFTLPSNHRIEIRKQFFYFLQQADGYTYSDLYNLSLGERLMLFSEFNKLQKEREKARK